MFSIIACIGKNRELGNRGGLVFDLKNDMKFFKEKTMGHTVIMGYRTWMSLKKKLPERRNLVVSDQGMVEGADDTILDLPAFIRENLGSSEEIFVIGGGMIYQQFLPYAKRLYLTEVDAEREADTFFPEFEKSDYKREVLGEGEENGVKYQFIKYEKLN